MHLSIYKFISIPLINKNYQILLRCVEMGINHLEGHNDFQSKYIVIHCSKTLISFVTGGRHNLSSRKNPVITCLKNIKENIKKNISRLIFFVFFLLCVVYNKGLLFRCYINSLIYHQPLTNVISITIVPFIYS